MGNLVTNLDRRPHVIGGRGLALILAGLLACLLTSCESVMPEAHPDTPTGNFDALWNDFDQTYALFDIRGIDWDSLYTVYRPRIHDGISDRELAEVMCEMLAELEDGHVTLKAEDVLYCDSGNLAGVSYFPDGNPEHFLPEFHSQVHVIKNTYMNRWEPSPGVVAGLLIDPGESGKTLGYLWLDGFGNGIDWDAVEAWLRDAQDFDALFIDLRNNPGGLSSNQERVVNLIADAARPYLRFRQRNGPSPDDFGPEEIWSMVPMQPGFADKPLVVITDPFSSSAAEWFTLAARVMPHATVIGDTTRGIYSGRWDRVLPNTWEYSSSGMVVRDMDGMTWEGVGLPPEIQVRNTLEANEQNRDLALDEALRILLDELSP